MRRLLISIINLLFALSSVARAQGLRERISQLFIFGAGEDPLFLGGSADPSNPASIRRTARTTSRPRSRRTGV